jgi:beta-mannanase
VSALAAREYAVSALLVVSIAALLALQVLGPWSGRGEAGPQPWPAERTAAGSLALGVTTLSLARDAFRPWEPDDLGEVDAFERGARAHADVVMWFADWAHGRFDARQARAVARRGSVPEISWEPWDATVGPRRAQPRYALGRIAEGRHDAYVRRFARAVARYGGPVRLRFAQEMNGRWYPWSESANGNRRGQFVRAWRHVHGLFAAEGATNVTWIWAPVAGGLRREQYPGPAYVDVLGVSGFNGGGLLFRRQGWRSFPDAFGMTLDALHHLAPGKPVALSEIASTERGGDKAQWIREMFAEIRRRPYVRALVWFNLRKEADWRIDSSDAAREAFARGIATVRRPAA